MAYLTIGDQVFSLNKTECRYTIGRHNSCDVSINSLYASRQHAKIQECVDGHHLLVDVSSRNGLFVNGKKAKLWTLANRDVITIGSVNIVFHAGLPEHMESNFGTISGAKYETT